MENMDTEIIKEKITKLKADQASLTTSHDSMVKMFQAQQQAFNQRVQDNQVKFQQMAGAISQLELLLSEIADQQKEKHDNTTHNNSQCRGTDPHPGDVPHRPNHNRGSRRADLRH